MVGGWGNSRIQIRKKSYNNTITEITVDEAISLFKPTKIFIEVANTGHINLYLNNKPEPVISAYDPNPLQVKYVSFASHQSSQVEFLYNCASDKSGNPATVRTTSAPPTDDTDLSKATVDSECGTLFVSLSFFIYLYIFVFIHSIGDQMQMVRGLGERIQTIPQIERYQRQPIGRLFSKIAVVRVRWSRRTHFAVNNW